MMAGRSRFTIMTAVLGLGLTLSGFPLRAQQPAPSQGRSYQSPHALALTRDGKTLFVADRGDGKVFVLDVATRSLHRELHLKGQPSQIALSPDDATLYVAQRGAGTVAIVNTRTGTVFSEIPVGRWPRTLAVAARARRLYVGNQDTHDVSVIELEQTPGTESSRVPVIREPSDMAISPDESLLVVANQLPLGRGTDASLAARVSIIDCERLAVIDHVALPPGSTVVNGVCVSPDGKWAYAVHQIARFNLPITQLERGWVTTSALSILDLSTPARVATVLLDELTQGSADPHTVVCSRDGRELWISHAGVHTVSNVHIGVIHELLNGSITPELADLKDGSGENLWVRIQQDRSLISQLENDLTALHLARAIRRFPSDGLVPQELLLSPDETQLFVANEFSNGVAVLRTDNGHSLGTLPLPEAAEPDAARRGELIFRDARHAFQRWHSCATCHPNGGRVDGLRWDFLRDGIGNPKETISLILVGSTPPHNWRGTRTDARMGAETSLVSGHLIVPTAQTVDDLTAYLLSLRPEPNPHLTADGQLTESATRGRVLFEGKAACARCHPAPLFTDRKMHNVGVLSPHEPDGRYDTPTLVEIHRTAPYLHDGRALSLDDVLTTHNRDDRHGAVRDLSPAELSDLIAYLRSL